MTGSFIVEPLGPSHDRTEFTCGVDALDRYFREQAGQDVRRHVTACFVAREVATNRIAGFYTLAAAGVLLAQMPARLAKRLPRYPAVPVARLGRLAVAGAYHGRKLGGALLWDAVERASRSEVAVYALVVDAKDEQAESFYLHHGFVPFGDTPVTSARPVAAGLAGSKKQPTHATENRSLTFAARIGAARWQRSQPLSFS